LFLLKLRKIEIIRKNAAFDKAAQLFMLKWANLFLSKSVQQTQPIITEKHCAIAYDWAKANKATKSISDSQFDTIEVPARCN
jgi:hypothetical protein